QRGRGVAGADAGDLAQRVELKLLQVLDLDHRTLAPLRVLSRICRPPWPPPPPDRSPAMDGRPGAPWPPRRSARRRGEDRRASPPPGAVPPARPPLPRRGAPRRSPPSPRDPLRLPPPPRPRVGCAGPAWASARRAHALLP